MMTLEQIADLLDRAPRHGKAPERDRGPVGKQVWEYGLGAAAVAAESGAIGQVDRYVRISDAIAREISASLRAHAQGESPRAVALERR